MSVINTNVNALVSQESMRSSNLKMSRAMERLSTGQRINSAKDDAAGLSISNRMTAQVRGLQMAVRNSNDAISMSQTAEGAYGQVGNILQRMRELAVQSASGTMSAVDRASIQLEIDELTAEINHIAATTNHNNIKLLDGSAKGVVIQTGADQVDTISMDFESVKANHLGSDTKPALTSYGASTANTGSLAVGDLIINGVVVGASFAVDDDVSFMQNIIDGDSDPVAHNTKAMSAIAKAAAINKVSDQTGVEATVESTLVAGNSMTLAATISSTVAINGVRTAEFKTNGTDNAISRDNTVRAINAISGATGVVAIDTNSDTAGIQLFAEDGRNIVVSLGTAHTITGTGLAGNAARATHTFVGSYSLSSVDGSDITIDSMAGKNPSNATEFQGQIENAGLSVGTYKGGMASFVTDVRTQAAFAAPTSAVSGVLNGDTLIINDIQIAAATPKDDVTSYVQDNMRGNFSAIATANAINKSYDQTGVKAEAGPTVLRGNATVFTGGNAAVLSINGAATETMDTSTITAVIEAVNSISGTTGVVASRFGDQLELRAEDGRNIAIAATTNASALGLAGVTIGAGTQGTEISYFGTVTLESDRAFKVDHGFEGRTNFEALGFNVGTYGGAVGDKLVDVDISSQNGASSGLRVIDTAINQVSSAQAESGALNNRLDVILNNLTESIQNMSASRSRILDTDYATETTALAKQQIIQQAATAMLAQANQMPQTVLALLQ